jgi:hypothetical protein
MNDELFVISLGLLLAVLFRWGFKNLPKEKWQVLATVPRVKDEGGAWTGINFTYYGFFNAAGMLVAVALWFVLLGARGAPVSGMAAVGIPLIAVFRPASRLIAKWVEKKPFTATIGGASFVLVLLAPWVVLFVDRLLGPSLGFRFEPLVILSALAIGYTYGEAVGRLSCISFGCCYGKPLAQCPPIFRTLFGKYSFIFSGKTKKIAYAHGFDGERVFPIQAVTSVFYALTALAGTYLFLKGGDLAALLLTLILTQIWRVVSEFLRADERGGGMFSVYQLMAGFLILYSLGIGLLFPAPTASGSDIWEGLKIFGSPFIILFLQTLWAVSFFLTGRSWVTGSVISFHVFRDRI